MTMWIPNLEERQGPRYRAIAAAIREDVRAGRLAPGDKLPPHRELAWRLGVTVGTVSRAYAEGQRAGILDSHVGRGTFVVDPSGAAPRAQPTDGRDGLDLVHNNVLDTVLDRDGTAPGLIEMAANYPARGRTGELLSGALSSLSEPAALEAASVYEEWGGQPAHREAGAAWIARYGGFAPAADELILCPGVQAGLSAVLGALMRPGDTLLTEALTWPGIRAQMGHSGWRLAPVAMDGEGLVPEALERAIRATGSSVLYTMPNLHNPTTVTTPAPRRRAILEIARQNGVTIVEDDIYGFLLDDVAPPYAALAPDHAVYIVSVSKAVAPALRVGWIRAPQALRSRVLSALRSITVMASPITGEIAARAIATGAAHELAAYQREEAEARAAMARHALGPALECRPPRSMHGWLHLPEGWGAADFIAECQRRGVMVTRGDAFDPGGTDRVGAVRVCLSAVAERTRLSAGLAVIAETLRTPAGSELPLV